MANNVVIEDPETGLTFSPIKLIVEKIEDGDKKHYLYSLIDTVDGITLLSGVSDKRSSVTSIIAERLDSEIELLTRVISRMRAVKQHVVESAEIMCSEKGRAKSKIFGN